jgi:hypothetical protein
MACSRMRSEHDEFRCGCAGQPVVRGAGGPSGEQPHQGRAAGMQGGRRAILPGRAQRQRAAGQVGREERGCLAARPAGQQGAGVAESVTCAGEWFTQSVADVAAARARSRPGGGGRPRGLPRPDRGRGRPCRSRPSPRRAGRAGRGTVRGRCQGTFLPQARPPPGAQAAELAEYPGLARRDAELTVDGGGLRRHHLGLRDVAGQPDQRAQRRHRVVAASSPAAIVTPCSPKRRSAAAAVSRPSWTAQTPTLNPWMPNKPAANR